MGQQIEIVGSNIVGGVLVVTTDRSVSGQDGASFESVGEAAATDSFPARLALKVFEAVDGITHVFTASNTVVMGRERDWDAPAVSSAEDVVRRFFVFYGDESELETSGA
jgi:hypothetical protein